MDIYRSACKHGVADADILRAVDHALGAAEQDDGKVLYLNTPPHQTSFAKHCAATSGLVDRAASS